MKITGLNYSSTPERIGTRVIEFEEMFHVKHFKEGWQHEISSLGGIFFYTKGGSYARY